MSASLQRRKRYLRVDREGVTFETTEIRDGSSSKEAAHSARRQALESTPAEGVSGHEGKRRVTATIAKVASAISESSALG